MQNLEENQQEKQQDMSVSQIQQLQEQEKRQEKQSKHLLDLRRPQSNQRRVSNVQHINQLNTNQQQKQDKQFNPYNEIYPSQGNQPVPNMQQRNHQQFFQQQQPSPSSLASMRSHRVSTNDIYSAQQQYAPSRPPQSNQRLSNAKFTSTMPNFQEYQKSPDSLTSMQHISDHRKSLNDLQQAQMSQRQQRGGRDSFFDLRRPSSSTSNSNSSNFQKTQQRQTSSSSGEGSIKGILRKRESGDNMKGMRYSSSVGNMMKTRNSRKSLHSNKSLNILHESSVQNNSVVTEKNETFNNLVPYQAQGNMLLKALPVENSLVPRGSRMMVTSTVNGNTELVPNVPVESSSQRTAGALALQSLRNSRKFQQGWDLVMGDHFNAINRHLGEDLILQAMEEGCLVARGFCLFRGWGNLQQDLSEALALFTVSANQGNINAMAMKGYFYRNGYGTDENDTEAIFWLKTAVKGKHSWAMGLMAYCYQEGEGIKRDTKEAVRLYKKSADLGYCKSMFNVAELYAKGQWVDKDPQLALKWYKRALEQDYEKALPALRALEKKIRKPSRRDKSLLNQKLSKEDRRRRTRGRSRHSQEKYKEDGTRSKSISSRRSKSAIRRSKSVK